MPTITFTTKDSEGIIFLHDDPLVVTLNVANYVIHGVLVDGKSSCNILFMTAFNKTNIGLEHLKAASYPVTHFTGASIIPKGAIKLPMKIGHEKKAKDLMVEFHVVDVPASFNAIIGQPLIHDARAVMSTYQLTMMYMSNVEQQRRVKDSRESARSCYLSMMKGTNQKRKAEEHLDGQIAKRNYNQ